MARNELQNGFQSIQKERATMSIRACLRMLSLHGSNREGAAIVASFQAQMDYEEFNETQAIAS